VTYTGDLYQYVGYTTSKRATLAILALTHRVLPFDNRRCLTASCDSPKTSYISIPRLGARPRASPIAQERRGPYQLVRPGPTLVASVPPWFIRYSCRFYQELDDSRLYLL